VLSGESREAGEGFLTLLKVTPLTRLNLAPLDFATLSHKGRGGKKESMKTRRHFSAAQNLLPPCEICFLTCKEPQ